MKEYVHSGRKALSLIAVASLLLFMTGIAAAAKTTTTKDEKKLNTEISLLDKDAAMPKGEVVVTDKLSKTFNLTSDQIKTLRDKNLKYGEIAAIYAFADKMAGGITDDNVNKVMTMRQSNKAWSDIAKSFDVKLGSVAGKVSSIEKDAHKDIKKASTEMPGAAGGGTSRSRGAERGGY